MRRILSGRRRVEGALEKLSTLRPAFKKEGSVTAGNASGINDGASFVLIASEEAVKQYNLTPLCEIIGVGQGGVDPAIMGMGPVPAIANALKNAGIKLFDIDVIELNEAFAAQSLGVIHELMAQHGVTREWINERTNINGGAIALGHPIGASGNRIVVSLVHEMINNEAKFRSQCRIGRTPGLVAGNGAGVWQASYGSCHLPVHRHE